MKIYIGNLATETTEDTLRASFETFGTVDSLKIILDKATGNSKGFAFVEMAADDKAQDAIVGLHGKELDGNPLKVSEVNKR